MKGFSRKSFVLLICVSLILDWNVILAEKTKENGKEKTKENEKEKKYKLSPLCAIVGGAAVFVGAPAAAATVGFGTAGIGAGTVAAKMMSWTAAFYGGGVTAGSLVATLQSIGAAGVSYGSALAGSVLGAAGCYILDDDEGTETE